MPTYRLQVATRDRHGTVGRALQDVRIEAAGVRQASARALGRADELFSDDATLVWLTDEAGELVWTLPIEEAERAEA
ncbi:hypothetical protein [Methylobacterium sp. ID0610]|uniref:hypothetical protein n=1 Tax=Methylobacterium carpenticola TaxID=3344827 RepID=UPI0036A5FE2A